MPMEPFFDQIVQLSYSNTIVSFFHVCKRAGAVHEGSDLLDGGIVLEDAVDIEQDDLFERVAVTPT